MIVRSSGCSAYPVLLRCYYTLATSSHGCENSTPDAKLKASGILIFLRLLWLHDSSFEIWGMMSNLYGQSEDQMVRPRPLFPKPHSKPRVGGIILNNRNGLYSNQAKCHHEKFRNVTLPANDGRATDRSYDAYLFRDALKDKGMKPCITSRKSRSKLVKYSNM